MHCGYIFNARFLDDPAGSGEALLAVGIVFLDRVQNLQIHAVRANFHIMFSVRSTAIWAELVARARPIFS